MAGIPNAREFTHGGRRGNITPDTIKKHQQQKAAWAAHERARREVQEEEGKRGKK